MRILAIGTAVPEHSIRQADSAAICRTFAEVPAGRSHLFDELYRRSGVATRHSVLLKNSESELEDRQSFYAYGRSPSTAERIEVYRQRADALALASSRSAIESSGLDPRRITHLITVSCTGFFAPGVDIALCRELPLQPSMARTHIGFMGCQGALNGLRVAGAFVESDPSACVLLCATELCSIHHQYGWDPEKIVANALFADGSAAAVLAGDTVATDRRAPKIVRSGATIVADSLDAMSWKIGDHGFEMTLSPRVPNLISTAVRPWLESWLAEQGRSVEDIRSWAVHPGGPRILSAFGEALGLARADLAASFETLACYGNMSSATVMFVLKSLQQQRANRPTVAIAFGPGLSIEAVLIE